MSKTFLVSDETKNSLGFTVLTEGIDISNFVKNPIMLYMHERPDVIGRWENLRIEDGKLYADAVFNEDDPKGKDISDKVKSNFLKAASIGITYSESDLVNGVLNKCVLLKISIVDIGSNPNALKLYNTENFISLYFEDIKNHSDLGQILELSAPTTNNIILAVKNLKTQIATLTQKNLLYEDLKEKEAVILVDDAIKRGFFPKQFKDMQLKLFKEDFHKAQAEIAEMYYQKYTNHYSLTEVLNVAQRVRKSKLEKGEKPKSEWDLRDYRLMAPKELESNPELFSRLLDEQRKALNNLK